MGPIPMMRYQSGMQNIEEASYHMMGNPYMTGYLNNYSFPFNNHSVHASSMHEHLNNREQEMFNQSMHQMYPPPYNSFPHGFNEMSLPTGNYDHGHDNYQVNNNYQMEQNMYSQNHQDVPNNPFLYPQHEQQGMHNYPTPFQPIGNSGQQYDTNGYNGAIPFPQLQGGYPYGHKNMSNSPFANPLESKKMGPYMNASFPNPYPKQAFMQKSQPSGFKSIMNQFKTQDGSMDVTKMMNTAGQMVGTVSQMQNVFKGLGGIFKATT